MTDSIESRLTSIPLFAGLAPKELAPLRDVVRQLSLKEGKILFRKGEPGTTMYLLEQGSLKVYTLGAGDGETVLDILGPGDVIGELALLDGEPRSTFAEAISDCDLLALDRGPFMEYLRLHPETAITLLTNLSTRVRKLVVQPEPVSTKDNEARLAQVLLFLAERDGKIETGLVTSRLNQKNLAEAIGASEEWVSQKLADWCSVGVIGMTGSRRLLLHDVESLVQISHREE
jgi:CRP-like cAMP-binding protein